jgi:rSAM/selenodomain-associated transferase 1
MSCAIAIMAKAPQPGVSKTRLVPPLNFAQAASLSAAFLRDISENLRLASEHVPLAPYVAYAPAGGEVLFDGVIAPGTHFILADGQLETPANVSGFGRCLLHAVRGLFDLGYASVCVLNSDSPTLPTATLRRAVELLHMPGDRAVLGPADDGGYYLLGMKQVHPHLFADIMWSTDAVAAQTRERAHQARIPLVELPTWYDVDDAASLQRLREDLAAPTGLAYAAPATAAWLAAHADDAGGRNAAAA